MDWTCPSKRPDPAPVIDNSNKIKLREKFNLYKRCTSVNYSIVNTDGSATPIPNWLIIDRASGEITVDVNRNVDYTKSDAGQFTVEAINIPSGVPATKFKITIKQAECPDADELVDTTTPPNPDPSELIYYINDRGGATTYLRYMQRYI